MTANQQTRPWALLWVALGASLWGTDTLLRRPLTAALSSSQIVLTEHLILTAVLLPGFLRLWMRWRALRPLEWGAVVVIAWGGSALGTVFFTEAVKIGNPTTAVLLQKVQPFFAALLAWALLREPLGRRFWACLLLALAGGYLVSFGDEPDLLFSDPSALVPGRAAAVLLALGAAGFWAASTVLGRFVLKNLPFASLTVLRIIVATPFLMALTWVRDRPLLIAFEPRQAFSLLLMALIPGLAALLIYYHGLAHTRASLAAVAELSFPATAALLNWLFLGARVTVLQIAGFALLWGVILYLEGRSRAKRVQ